MNLLDYFPTKFTATSTQIDILKKIDSAIQSNIPNIILCAPTGIGKSAIATTVGRAMNSSFIVTAQKILQNQYVDDFQWLYSIKGKSNFLCVDLWDAEKESFDDAIRKPELRCTFGECIKKEKIGNNEFKFTNCDYKPRIEEYQIVMGGDEKEQILGPKNMCHYYDQKFKGLHASHTVFNYASFFQTLKFNQNFSELLNRNCLIADEAHEIEDQILEFIKFRLSKKFFKDSKIKLDTFDLTKNDNILTLLNELNKEYQDSIEQFEENGEDLKKIELIKNKQSEIKIILERLNNNLNNFVLEIDEKNKDNISIIPIEITDYVKEFFNFPTQLFMSATINKEMFCETMGFSEDDCEFIEIESSPFKKENRQVHFLNTVTLSRGPSEDEWKKAYSKTEELMKQHSNDRGIILTTSKSQCDDLLDVLDEDSWLRIKIVHSDIDEEKETIIQKHADSKKSSVLLSPSLWYGVDLANDLSRFQIILKTPFVPPMEKRIKIKAGRNWKWYQYTALVKLLQGFGRSIRNENDFAITYVLDSKALELLQSMKQFVPKAYHDILPI